MGRWLVIIGISLLAVGLLVLAIEKFAGGGKLPGDIVIKRENFTFYFPLATSIIVSIVLSIIIYIINRLR